MRRKGINPGNPYDELYRKLQELKKYIDKCLNIEALDDIPTPPATPNDLKNAIEHYSYKVKPNLVLAGAFDAGKSHLANWLLGSKILPEGYQPATRLITFVRHDEDRPEWCKDNVLIVDSGIDFALLNNQEHYESHCIIAGGFDLLQEYGVHGENEHKSAYAAIVYLNSTLLKACNLVDLPGYSDEPDEVSQDAEKAITATMIADILIYASPAKGHVNGQDMIRFSSLLELLPTPEQECKDFPTLGNFFVVATHADSSISDEQLKGIPKRAAQRLYKNLGEAVLQRRGEKIKRVISEEDLQKRFFTFWSNTPRRCQAFSDDLTNLLKSLFPKVRMTQISREIQASVEFNAKKSDILIQEYKSKLTDDIEHKRAKLKALEDNELTRHPESQRRRQKVSKRIEELKQDSKSTFQRKAAQILTVDNVERIIRSKYDSKSEAQEYLTGYLTEQLKHELTQIIEKNAEAFKPEIEEFLKSYEVTLELPDFNETINIADFDVKASFLGGLAGLGGFGALGFWAATLGNLGGYILVAKLVSLLSALGISFGLTGGTAGVMVIVAAIGGPIVLGAALMAGLAMTVWSLFGESWEKRLAKKAISDFEEKNINQFQKAIDQYWEDTAKAFKQGADAVETDWQKSIENSRQDVSGDATSKERLEKIVYILQQLLEFWQGMPNLNWDC